MKTFSHGGIHPPENKVTADCSIEMLPIPESVVIPVSQHIGAPAVPAVSKGEKIRTGQLIATANNFVSANVHSSVSGTVSKIDTIVDGSGFRQTAIFIDVSGDEWVETIDRDSTIRKKVELSREEIIKKCLEAGIVGLGGATFPSHVKLTVPAGKTCQVLIINGVECEPFLTADHRLMLEKGEEILVGISILMKALGTNRAVIGIESNKQNAIRYLEKLSEDYDGITVQGLKVKYPQGAEKQLIKALIKREVPSGHLPIDVGVVVHNVATAYAVYEAIQKNKPLFERVVTVTGMNLTRPGNYLVRTGTLISKLVEAAGGDPESAGKVINGGPMMGKAVSTTSIPVVKGMSGIIVFPEEGSLRRESGPCIRCSKCISVCPMNLEPYLLTLLSEKGLFEKASNERITDCMECGSCSYICPAHRPVLDYIRLGKSTVMKMAKEKNLK